jgi:phosphopantothenoylcysteine decarboxylase/phosphopantothenate--cysteine ligase
MVEPTPKSSDDARPLDGRRVLVGLSGGIAAYKTAALVSRLTQRGADVRVVMTDAATRFITPLTLQSLSGHPVLTSLWDHDDRPDAQHVGLARWAELIVVAPATADLIAKLAAGLTPDLVTLTCCARPATTPLLLAPAMNADMWANPIVQRNLQTLRDLLPNLHEVGPEEGWQACRTSGAGRMAEAEAILEAVVERLESPRGRRAE